MFASEEAWTRVQRYAAWLAGPGVERGLIGPREVPRVWGRHLLNCAGLESLVPTGASVVDVGSGAGLPGLVLALQRDDVTVTLVDSLLRRARFLEEVVADLGLDHVSVRRSRVEDLGGEVRADVVTARAVAPLARLVPWCLPLVAPRGSLLAMKGESVHEEVAQSAALLRRWGCAPAEVVVLDGATPATPGDEPGGGAVGEPPAQVVRVRWADPERVSWPVEPPGRAPSPPRTGRRSRSRKGAR